MCSEIAKALSLEFNDEKSHYIITGKKSASDVSLMNLCGNPLNGVLCCLCPEYTSTKYYISAKYGYRMIR